LLVALTDEYYSVVSSVVVFPVLQALARIPPLTGLLSWSSIQAALVTCYGFKRVPAWLRLLGINKNGAAGSRARAWQASV
jgi:hypothetical protein